ncbi:MAG: SdpI family protein [Chloroflexi bacterium]|nr:SdpI family protein [Chloroflexota bacterium]
MGAESLLTRRVALIASAATLIALFALSAWAWTAIDGDRIPVHWGINGQPDRYGGKFEGLMILPLVSVGLVALFAVIPLIEPRREHLLSSMPAYVLVWLALLAYLLVFHAALLFAAFGHEVNMGTVAAGSLGLLFLAIGAALTRVRSNFMFGVCTPWTLSSERSWQLTHRLAGRLFSWAGVASLIASAIAPVINLDWLPIATLLVGALGASLVSVVYSYIVWRGDTGRERTGA